MAKHRKHQRQGAGRQYLYGRQPVREALRAQRRDIHRLLIRGSIKQTPDIEEILSLAKSLALPVGDVNGRELDLLTGDGNDQGLALEVGPYPYVDLCDVRGGVKGNAEALVLCLDHIEDPQNVGSLLRSADAMGVTAVLIPQDRAAHVTPAAVRASAGASEHMQVCIVTNLVRAMEELKEDGLWFSGLEAREDAVMVSEQDFTGPVGLVVGSEGRGMKRLVTETCDFLVKLPMEGQVTSLNAAVAGAMALYEIRRQRAVTV